jgi:hypothetical protein
MGDIERCDCADKPDATALAVEWRVRAAKWEQTAGEERVRADRAERQLRGAVDLVEQARGCVTAALNCTAHPWHGDDRARKWLMDADRLGGQ